MSTDYNLNFLSSRTFASDARDTHTPVSDQGDCPPPPPALLTVTQDSMPRERRHLVGDTECELGGYRAVLVEARGLGARAAAAEAAFRRLSVEERGEVVAALVAAQY